MPERRARERHNTTQRIGAIVLAAGKGTRLRSTMPKVLHEVAGKSMIDWVLGTLSTIELEHIVVVVGHQATLVQDAINELRYPNVSTVYQREQRGTGHAVRVALNPPTGDESPLAHMDTILVINGDCPALTTASLRALVEASQHHHVSLLTTHIDNPDGYGRIIRTNGHVTQIVEQADVNEIQANITEINAGIYAFEQPALGQALTRLTSDNAQGEEYITDLVALLSRKPGDVGAVVVPRKDVEGINDQVQLAHVAHQLRQRINEGHMAAGVVIEDPQTTYIEPSVVIKPGATILPNTHLKGDSIIESGAVVGPDSELRDSHVHMGAVVERSVVRSSIINAQATVGPYAHLRPGTVLEEQAKAGGFVEIKKSTIGKGSKVPHLSYIGDAMIGASVNIGAGTITCNYDGYSKYPTIVGDNVFIGSDSMLIAPITVGEYAYVAAGSAITQDVPAGSLAIERSPQANKEDWSFKFHARNADDSEAPQH